MRSLLTAGCFVIGVLVATEASAQYKNSSFGAYGGAMILLPSNNLNWWKEFQVTSAGGTVNGNQRTPTNNPFTLANAMFSFEFSFKISLESWFLKTGLNVGFVNVVDDPTTCFAGPKCAVGGVVFWLEGMFGPRYYFLTDNVRPFFELGIRLAGLIYTTQAGDIMPPNFKVLPGVYGTFGLEFIVARDIGITIQARGSYFIIVNFPPGIGGIEGQAGVIAYF